MHASGGGFVFPRKPFHFLSHSTSYKLQRQQHYATTQTLLLLLHSVTVLHASRTYVRGATSDLFRAKFDPISFSFSVFDQSKKGSKRNVTENQNKDDDEFPDGRGMRVCSSSLHLFDVSHKLLFILNISGISRTRPCEATGRRIKEKLLLFDLPEKGDGRGKESNLMPSFCFWWW